jgi:hypothetical protein
MALDSASQKSPCSRPGTRAVMLASRYAGMSPTSSLTITRDAVNSRPFSLSATQQRKSKGVL